MRAPRNSATRPSADRVKEALYSMIENLLSRADEAAEIGTEELWQSIRAIDLYAGSGGLGIEALSRGAELVQLVEADRAAILAIRQNLQVLPDGDHRARVIESQVRRALPRIRGPVNLVMMDPPYGAPDVLEVATEVSEAEWLAADAILVLEHGRRLAAPAKLGNLQRQRDRKYGESVLTLYARGRYDRESAAEGLEAE